MSADVLDYGAWVVGAGGVSRWVPDAGKTLPRDAYRAVLAERYADPTWFATPPERDNSELTCARRRAACAADFARFDRRVAAA